MSGVQEAYNSWAEQYDTNANRTRDMEAKVLVSLLSSIESVKSKSFLEIGCGTGKNTVWLKDNFSSVTSVDFSQEMLSIAQQKVVAENVVFRQGDITQPWSFATDSYDAIGFSLVLEHIQDLDFVFSQIALKIKPNGIVYIGELHPFKQYAGTKARFESQNGTMELTCFVHHISEFVQTAQKYGLQLLKLTEHFDEENREGIPRILGLLLIKE